MKSLLSRLSPHIRWCATTASSDHLLRGLRQDLAGGTVGAVLHGEIVSFCQHVCQDQQHSVNVCTLVGMCARVYGALKQDTLLLEVLDAAYPFTTISEGYSDLLYI
eukprot:GHVS01091651.1.p1 GENE.GHVS01091651.1~~GHVS01091651.1.p1  ORF type:complete len:106 (-),score=10.65 GHVS01091651.1:59-376(-)